MAKQFDHEMTVTEYFEAIDYGKCEINLRMTTEVWGYDADGNLVKVPMPEHINCRCIMSFEDDAIIFTAEKKE